MRIGVLTFHDTANFGAALQTYATVEGLRSRGHLAEIINYSNNHRSAIYNVGLRLRRQLRNGQISEAFKTLAGALLIQQRLAGFDAFYRRYTPRSSKRIEDAAALPRCAVAYDAAVAGSDQIWTKRHNGSDTSYLTVFIDDPARAVSFPSSLGAVDLPEEERDTYALLLAPTPALSFRERTGAEIVYRLTDRSIPTVLYPISLPKSEDSHRLGYSGGVAVRGRHGLLDYMAKPGILETFIRTTRLKGRFHPITRIGAAVLSAGGNRGSPSVPRSIAACCCRFDSLVSWHRVGNPITTPFCHWPFRSYQPGFRDYRTIGRI